MTSTAEPISSAQLGEIARMSAVLADHVLEALATNASVPPEPAVALANAALMLCHHGVELPPALVQALGALAARVGPPPEREVELSQAVVDLIADGLSRYLARARSRTQWA